MQHFFPSSQEKKKTTLKFKRVLQVEIQKDAITNKEPVQFIWFNKKCKKKKKTLFKFVITTSSYYCQPFTDSSIPFSVSLSRFLLLAPVGRVRRILDFLCRDVDLDQNSFPFCHSNPSMTSVHKILDIFIKNCKTLLLNEQRTFIISVQW